MTNDEKKRYIILIVLVLVAVMFGLTTKAVKENRNLNFLEKSIKDTTTFVMKTLYKPIGFIKEKIKEGNEKDKMYKEYKKLKEKVAKIDSDKARIKTLENEVDDLKKSLELNSSLTEYKKINATVVNRIGGNWYNILTIDKGSKAGIKEGMAVVVNEGLIGKIINVSNFSSTVKLLTTDELNNKMSVQIQVDDKNIYGLLSKYDSEKKVYLIEGISDGSEIKKGSSVTTTGLTEAFPSGILIGEVKDVVVDDYELAKVVEVTPSVNFNDINIVTVLDRDIK